MNDLCKHAHAWLSLQTHSKCSIIVHMCFVVPDRLSVLAYPTILMKTTQMASGIVVEKKVQSIRGRGYNSTLYLD